MRKHTIGGKRVLVWIVGLLLIINQSVFLSESMVYGLTGDPGSTETVFMLTDQLEADQNYVIASGDSGKVSILEGDDSGINSLSAEVITDENGTYIKELPAEDRMSCLWPLSRRRGIKFEMEVRYLSATNLSR